MAAVTLPDVRLRPVTADDLPMLRRFATEPGLVGPNWAGFSDAGAVERRFAADGYLGEEDGRLVVAADDERAGCVSWHAVRITRPSYWNIGIVLLPEFRGRGFGWRAQAMLADYLFEHTPVVRIEAGTQPENVAEQRALEKAGFQREGVLRAVEFRAGAWSSMVVYGKIREGVLPEGVLPE
jgi:RimJ/RimL family protein N-acetyltransferase